MHKLNTDLAISCLYKSITCFVSCHASLYNHAAGKKIINAEVSCINKNIVHDGVKLSGNIFTYKYTFLTSDLHLHWWRLLYKRVILACLYTQDVECPHLMRYCAGQHHNTHISAISKRIVFFFFQMAYNRVSYGPFNPSQHLKHARLLYDYIVTMGSLISCCYYFCYSYTVWETMLATWDGHISVCLYSLSIYRLYNTSAIWYLSEL